ncbi:uncharacterized protein involved in exopolysaccharide biosynthesis [Rhodoblastus acidophilus]|uniref:exopolysaccharide transport family protein n=1 Tax=Rhodoblastus acidophilus TaxID=1074 RepID=UPI002224F0FF|nr:exopolysaccharide transport family protein [Rhodoblastus acidophilus]MCW2318248.1 uncharacterized protein involved in exopolysaccharide biosynthesis [Rhodoblastus acidophilus]
MSAGIADYDPHGGREDVDLSGILTALARNKGLLLGATAGCAIAAAAFCMVVKPRYLAEARVLIEDQESYFTRADPALREGPQVIDAEAINSQIQLVNSRDLARKAVTMLQLQKQPEFEAASGFGAILSLLGGGLAGEDRLLTSYFDHLTVLSPAKSRILQIEFTARDPDLAARAANTVADVYIDMKQQAKRDEARQAAQSLKPLIADLQRRALDAESKVADFRVANGLFESSENRSLPAQQLGELASKLADARAAQSEALAKAKSLRDLLSRGRLSDAGEIANNDLVRTIASRRSAAQALLATESRTLLPAHPRIKELQAQLSDIETQLRAAVEKAARGLDNDARVAASRVVNLSALLDEQKRMVGLANGEETKLRELQREAKTLKDQLENESTKYQVALARGTAENTPADARVVSRALAPSAPVFPKVVPITLFGALAGLFFSSFFVIARELSSATPRAPAPAPEPGDSGAGVFGRKRARGAAAAAQAASAPPAQAGAKAEAEAPPPAALDAETPAAPAAGLFARLKQALADFGAPALKLEADEPPETPRQELELELEQAPAQPARQAETPYDDIWARDPFSASAPAPDAAAAPAPAPVEAAVPAPAESAALAAPSPLRRAQPQVSRDLIARIVAAGDAHGVTALFTEASEASPLYALVAARALCREGRAILVQAGADLHLDAALLQGLGVKADAQAEPGQAPAQPGLAQLLAGEASYAEAIFRDGESRLHLLASGGRFDADAEDLRMIIDVLRATYDFVLIAAGADALGLGLARQADAVVVLGQPCAARDALREAFEAADARRLIVASPDDDGQLAEGAA